MFAVSLLHILCCTYLALIQSISIKKMQCDNNVYSPETFEKSLDCVKGSITSWQKEQEKLNLNTNLLKEKILDNEDKLKMAETKLELLTEKKLLAEKELSFSKEAMEKANAANFQMCSENCRLECELSKERKKREELEKDHEKLKSRLEELRDKTCKCCGNGADLQRNKEFLEEQLRAMSSEYDEYVAETKNEKSKMQEKIDILSCKFSEAKKANSYIRNQSREQRLLNKSWEEKFTLLKAKLTEIEESRNLLKSRCDSMLLDAERSGKKLQEFSRLENTHNYTVKENSFFQEKLAELTREFSDAKKLCDQETQARLAAEEMSVMLEKKCAKLNDSKDTLERKLKATEDNLATANDKIKELETSLHSQKSRIDSVEARNVEIGRRFDQMLTEAGNELKQKIDECSELQRTQIQMESELRESRRVKVELEQRLKHTLKNEASICKRNQELESEVKQLAFQASRQMKDLDISDRSYCNER